MIKFSFFFVYETTKQATHNLLICLFANKNFTFSLGNWLNLPHNQLSLCVKISVNDHYNQWLTHHYLKSLFLKNYTVTHFIVNSGLILVSFVHILKAMDKNKITPLILLDLSKVFNSTDHDRLLWKISAMGASLDTLKWFKSYFLGRSQAVCIRSMLCYQSAMGYRKMPFYHLYSSAFTWMTFLMCHKNVVWSRTLMTLTYFYHFHWQALTSH